MKKSIIYAVLLVIGFSMPPSVLAQSKVGFVNMSRIEDEAPQVEAIRNKLQKEFAGRDRELVRKQKKLKALENKLKRDGPALSESKRRAIERDIKSAQRDLVRAQDEFREDLNIRKNEELADLSKLFADTISAYARANKYDIILAAGVVYASDAADVTDAVLKRLAKVKKRR